MHPALVDRPVVLFDFFHTLSAIELACPEAPSTRAMLGVPEERWNALWWERDGDARATGAIADVEARLGAVIRELVPGIADADVAAAVAVRAAKFDAAMTRIEPEVLAILGRLRAAGKRLGLVSNADHLEIRAWPASPLAPLFEVAIFSCQVGCAKPDPAIYRLACDRLGVAPVDCAFVGDGNSDELRGARVLGMVTVQQRGILRRFHPHLVHGRGLHADHHVDDLTALSPPAIGVVA